MDEETAEIEPETSETEAEQTAELALEEVDDLAATVARLEVAIIVINDRIAAIESNAGNDRSTGDSSGDKRSVSATADDSEAETNTPHESGNVIRPNREHPYYRKLW